MARVCACKQITVAVAAAEVEALLLWQRPEHSAAALGSATIAFLALRMSGLTAPTLAALLLLARMAANVCAKLRPRCEQPLPPSCLIARWR